MQRRIFEIWDQTLMLKARILFPLIVKPIRLTHFFLTLTLSLCATAPIRAQAYLKKLSAQWEIVENAYQGKNQFLSAFTLTNKSNIMLPASGWTIYFNFARTINSTATGDVNIKFIKGDLYALTPSANFKGINPGAALRVEFVSSDWAVNISDAPTGLYVIWDTAPDKGISITDVSVKPSTESKQYMFFPGDKIGMPTPETNFNQNKNVKDIPLEQLPKIFPTPISYLETDGVFNLTESVSIVADEAFRKEADYLVRELAPLLGKKLTIVSAAANSFKNIFLTKKDIEPDAYELNVKPEKISIEASTAAGLFYGIQSLKILMPPSSWSGVQAAIAIPAVEAKDAPRFSYRGFFLDVCRNFQSKKQVLKLLDLMSLYKLNVFHFHITDDEGWRIEIPTLPELTTIGSKRGHTLDSKKNLPPSFGSGPDSNNSVGSGFYSRAEFVEILRYATERHIQVIPEIETPGHARAAVKSMAARYERLMKEGKKEDAEKYLLHDLGDQSKYKSVQGWDDNVINVALPSTYRFLETVMDDILAMYKEADAPIRIIHFGGDEVPAGVWEKSPACLELMKNNPAVKSVDDLWYYYYGKVNELVKKKGVSLYGWEEIAMRKTKRDGNPYYIPNPDFVQDHFQVDVWNNVLGSGAEDLAYRLANAGYKVVLSCVTHLYCDMAYCKAFEEPGYYWGAFTNVDKPFSFIPYDYFKNSKEDRFGMPLNKSIFIGKDRLSDYGKSNILGVKGLLWSETIISPERMEYMILPKMLGLAERAWAKDPAWATEKDNSRCEQLYQQAWAQFVNVLGKRELPRLDNYAGGFNYRIPPPGVIIEDGQVMANEQFPGLSIRYTIDGTEPTSKSKLYTQPLTIKGKIKLRTFNSKGRGGNSVEVENR